MTDAKEELGKLASKTAWAEDNFCGRVTIVANLAAAENGHVTLFGVNGAEEKTKWGQFLASCREANQSATCRLADGGCSYK